MEETSTMDVVSGAVSKEVLLMSVVEAQRRIGSYVITSEDVREKLKDDVYLSQQLEIIDSCIKKINEE